MLLLWCKVFDQTVCVCEHQYSTYLYYTEPHCGHMYIIIYNSVVPD